MGGPAAKHIVPQRGPVRARRGPDAASQDLHTQTHTHSKKAAASRAARQTFVGNDTAGQVRRTCEVLFSEPVCVCTGVCLQRRTFYLCQINRPPCPNASTARGRLMPAAAAAATRPSLMKMIVDVALPPPGSFCSCFLRLACSTAQASSYQRTQSRTYTTSPMSVSVYDGVFFFQNNTQLRGHSRPLSLVCPHVT